MKIVLLSHGNLCVELKNSARMILGDFEDVAAFPLQAGEDTEEYGKKVAEYVRSHRKEGVLILTDLLGGSPFLLSSRLMEGAGGYEDGADIVTGVNLGMLLEVLNNKGSCSLEELCRIAVEAGRGGVKDFLEEGKRK